MRATNKRQLDKSEQNLEDSHKERKKYKHLYSFSNWENKTAEDNVKMLQTYEDNLEKISNELVSNFKWTIDVSRTKQIRIFLHMKEAFDHIYVTLRRVFPKELVRIMLFGDCGTFKFLFWAPHGDCVRLQLMVLNMPYRGMEVAVINRWQLAQFNKMDLDVRDTVNSELTGNHKWKESVKRSTDDSRTYIGKGFHISIGKAIYQIRDSFLSENETRKRFLDNGTDEETVKFLKFPKRPLYYYRPYMWRNHIKFNALDMDSPYYKMDYLERAMEKIAAALRVPKTPISYSAHDTFFMYSPSKAEFMRKHIEGVKGSTYVPMFFPPVYNLEKMRNIEILKQIDKEPVNFKEGEGNSLFIQYSLLDDFDAMVKRRANPFLKRCDSNYCI